MYGSSIRYPRRFTERLNVHEVLEIGTIASSAPKFDFDSQLFPGIPNTKALQIIHIDLLLKSPRCSMFILRLVRFKSLVILYSFVSLA